MAFESTVFCIDNSTFTLTDDFTPNRIYVECEGIHLICVSKTISNSSNYFGLVAMANVEILAPLSQNYNDVINKCRNLSLHKEIDFVAGLHMGYSMLIKRPNKLSKMKIVAFIASPCKINEKQLKKLMGILKKSKVIVEVIYMDRDRETLRVIIDFIMDLNGYGELKNHILVVLPDMPIAIRLRESENLPFGVDEERIYLLLAMNLSLEEKNQEAGTSAELKIESLSNINDEEEISEVNDSLQSLQDTEKK